MKIQTASICLPAGCNAQCPYCVSAMTPSCPIETNEQKLNDNFKVFCKLADKSDVTTTIITGKGEPTLYPSMITNCLQLMHTRFPCPFIELQTNGLKLYEALVQKDLNDYHNTLGRSIYDWRSYGVTTIMISLVHYDHELNRCIYTPGKEYIDIFLLVKKLHEIGFSVRLNVIMLKGFIDNVDAMNLFMQWAKNAKVDQITFRPVAMPSNTKNWEVYNWTKDHLVPLDNLQKIQDWFSNSKNATPLMELMHGAVVYDVNGQNVCFSNCLTHDAKTAKDELRQIIFFPDSSIRYDWCYEGARLL